MTIKDMFTWKLYGDGRSITPGTVVAPDERLSVPITVGIGLQHVVAMFGATFIVPVIMGFPTSTALFFSGVGTMLFLLITANRVPSYLGSSFALLAPVAAIAPLAQGATALDGPSISLALGGIVITGVALAVVGAVVHVAGAGWIPLVMPPVVTGTIVALIGFNLASAAKTNVESGPIEAVVTIIAILVITVLFRGLVGRLGIVLGVAVGYVAAVAERVGRSVPGRGRSVDRPADLPRPAGHHRRLGSLPAGGAGAGGRERGSREDGRRHDRDGTSTAIWAGPCSPTVSRPPWRAPGAGRRRPRTRRTSG